MIQALALLLLLPAAQAANVRSAPSRAAAVRPAAATRPAEAARAQAQPAPQSAAAAVAGAAAAVQQTAAVAVAPAANEAVGTAMTSFYDAGEKKGVPAAWVDAMIGVSQNAAPGAVRLGDVVQRNGFRDVALNREIIQRHSDQYTHEIPSGDVTNQEQSGRCWIFAGLNMIRSMLISSGKVSDEFQFSENYLHFFNMLEKANRHIETATDKLYRRRSPREDFGAVERRMTATPSLGDGGWSEYFMFLVSKYGLVPKSAMSETFSSASTATLLKELDDSLAATSAELMANAQKFKAKKAPDLSQEIKSRGMGRVWKILAAHLGTPPKSFDYRETKKERKKGKVVVTPTRVKNYTPKSFAKGFVRFKPEDYVSVSAYPGKKEGTVYEMKDSGIGAARPGEPRYDIRFLNVSSARLEELTVTALKGGQPAWFAADVHRDVDYETGIMHPGLFQRDAVYQLRPSEQSPALSRKERAYFSRITPNHAMLLTGFDRPKRGGPVVKFKVENSWGDEIGQEGIFHMYREWFADNVFEVVVHKKFLSPAEQKLLQGKPVQVRNDVNWY